MSCEKNTIKHVCRVCLEKSNKLYPLLGEIPNVDEDIASMIKYCTLIEVIIDNDLPQGVCIPCFKSIRIAYNFICQFRESNRKLIENKGYIECTYNLQKEPLCKLNLTEHDHLMEAYNSDNVEEIIIEYKEDFNSKVSSVTNNSINKTTYEEMDMLNENVSVIEEVLINMVSSADMAQKDDIYKDITIDQVQNESEFFLEKKDVQSFICPICRQSFSKFEVGFVKHLSTHEDVKLKCDKCSLETVLTIDLYIQHFKKAHRFQCEICNKSYGRRSGLYYHLKTHDNKRIYKCSYESCSKSFLTAWCLRKHIHTHSESAKYICSKCGSEFKTYGTYKYHQKTHDGNRSYLCTECGQTFLQLIHLKYHMWKHTGIKMFQCDKCHKSYTSQTQLKKHRKRKTCGFVSKAVKKYV